MSIETFDYPAIIFNKHIESEVLNQTFIVIQRKTL